MATTIMIPTPLRPYAGKQASVSVEGSTVGELLDHLTRLHAPLRNHLYDESGRLRAFVNVYVNDEDIRYLQKEETAVTDNDVVSIIPSIAGGKGGRQ
jgi:molybdopterin converting factor small subunit